MYLLCFAERGPVCLLFCNCFSLMELWEYLESCLHEFMLYMHRSVKKILIHFTDFHQCVLYDLDTQTIDEWVSWWQFLLFVAVWSRQFENAGYENNTVSHCLWCRRFCLSYHLYCLFSICDVSTLSEWEAQQPTYISDQTHFKQR